MKTMKVNGFKLKLDHEGKVKDYVLPYQVRNKQFKGNNGKNKFNLETEEAHSYGHWCYVKKIKGKWVFNDYSYSVTTNGHQGTMRQLLRELGIKIDLVVNMQSSLDDYSFRSGALSSMYYDLIGNEIKINNKFIKDKSYYVDANKELKKQISAARKLGAKYTRNDVKELRKRLEQHEVNRLTQAREQRLRVKEANKTLYQAKKTLEESGIEFDIAN
jgi:hypothetical protein